MESDSHKDDTQLIRELEEQAAVLKKLIEEAELVRGDVEAHLRAIRGAASAGPPRKAR
jgi:hypothetical protein